MRVGLIGGTGLRSLAADATPEQVATPWGTVEVQRGSHGGVDVVFLARHGAAHRVPPHRLPHRAHAAALRACGADAVLAVNNVGALRPDLEPGALVVPDDLVDLTGRSWTLFDDEVVHVSMTPPYCPHLRRTLLEAPGKAVDGGVYVQSAGPRLETPAEIRFMAGLGDVVGMTGAPEASLAREAGLCYASLCFVANHAAGVGAEADAQRIERTLAEAADAVLARLADAVGRVPAERDCACRSAPERGRISD